MVFQDTGHQTTKDSDPWKMWNKQEEHYDCPYLELGYTFEVMVQREFR